MHHDGLVHTSVPMPRAVKIPVAKAVADKQWDKLQNPPVWDESKVRDKADVIREAQSKKTSFVHFATLVDLCHLKHSELAAHSEKYRGRVVLRGENGDDAGCTAVQTLWTLCLGVTREANDTVSVSTQVEMKGAPQVLKLPVTATCVRHHSSRHPANWDKIN